MPRLNGSQSTRIFQWRHQPLLLQDLIPPVLNAWVDILPLTNGGVKALYLKFVQSNDEALAKDVEVRLTLDGMAPIVSTVSIANNENWYAFPNWDGLTIHLELAFQTGVGEPWVMGLSNNATQNELLIANSMRIEFRIVTALGTNQVLNVQMLHQTWSEV